MSKVPKQIEGLRVNFMERMKVFFAQKEHISLEELNVLLNDLFINEMGCYIRS